MGWLTFLADVAKALAWPVVAVYLTTAFREEVVILVKTVSAVLLRTKAIKYGDFAFEAIETAVSVTLAQTEDRATSANLRLQDEGLSNEDRVALQRTLSAAQDDAARLRAQLSKLQASAGLPGWVASDAGPSRRILAMDQAKDAALVALARVIGTEKILGMSNDELRSELQAKLPELREARAKMSPGFVHLEWLEAVDLLDARARFSGLAVIELRQVAEMLHRQGG